MALLTTARILVESPQPAVFIPVLLGAGLAVSLVAGLVERTAAAVNGGSSPRGGRGLAMGVLSAIVAVGLGTGAIWYVAHYRPTELGQGTTELTIKVSTRGQPQPAEQTVEVMGRYCARTAIAGVTVEQVVPASADTAVLVVTPLLDEEADRRFRGCLEDSNLDLHRMTVTDISLVPVRAAR